MFTSDMEAPEEFTLTWIMEEDKITLAMGEESVELTVTERGLEWLISEETAIETALPRETTGETIVDDESAKIIINVQSANSIYFGARQVSLEELRARLVREKRRASRETAVRIRTNRDVPYGAIEPILILCAQTGFTDVSFAVVEGD
ncbi:MAG: biopolymer transporter ExbD [Thermoguttaceae bacterium]|nr:biopolymer transporter ExbD [Thermoguttaceae bacterium]